MESNSLDELADGALNNEALPLLTAEPSEGPPILDLHAMREIRMRVHVPLGTVDLDLRGFLALEVGSVLQTNRQTGESLDISVNGTPVAKGEVRIHGERFAVRITEILRALVRGPDEGSNDDEETVPETD